MHVVCYDFETYWQSKDYTLSKMGPIEYIRDERFDPFMASFGIDSTAVFVAANSLEYPAQVKIVLDASINPECDVLIAHNGSGFDHLILAEHFGLHPRHMWDTILTARWVGLAAICPESHAAITDKLGTGKKEAGTVVSDGKHWPQDFTLEEQKFFAQYCMDDTAQMRMNLAKMLPYCTDDCLRFMSLTARMATAPVFILDEALLEEYIRQLDAEADEARRNLMQIFHFSSLPEFFTALRSADKFARMLRELGVEPPVKLSEAKTATAIARAEAAGNITEVERLKREGVMTYAFARNDVDFIMLTEHDDPRVRLLVETRLEFNSSMVRSRVATLLKYARYKKPVPIMLSAFKAHTGRYSAGISEEESKSDSLQFQNLSKRNPVYKPLRQAIKAPAGYSVVAVDSSQIEARCLAWEAQQLDLLGHFREGRDPYAELAVNFGGGYTAEQIHDGAKAGDKKCKHFRNLGKVFILSAGFGVGYAKVSRKLWTDKVKLHPDYKQHSELARSYLQIYRAANPNIVYFWKVCQQVIEALALGCSGSFGGPNNDTFKYGIMPIMGHEEWAVPTIMMPSGYALRYPNLRAVENDQGKIEYVYDLQRGKNKRTVRIYGGKLAENCIAEGTLVYTDSGWKPIEMIELSDKVYDGVDFVSHCGLLCKGVQNCVEVDGVGVTPEHKFLAQDGWYEAREVDVRKLTRPALRGTQGGGVYSSQSLESLQRKTSVRAQVYDILNCGPRHRFVVKGERGPVIVSNCTQCFAFQLLMWQSCRMDEDNIPIAGNNHDCWYNVVSDAQAEDMANKMTWHMRQLPSWAPGLPIDAEAEIGHDFTVC